MPTSDQKQPHHPLRTFNSSGVVSATKIIKNGVAVKKDLPRAAPVITSNPSGYVGFPRRASELSAQQQKEAEEAKKKAERIISVAKEATDAIIIVRDNKKGHNPHFRILYKKYLKNYKSFEQNRALNIVVTRWLTAQDFTQPIETLVGTFLLFHISTVHAHKVSNNPVSKDISPLIQQITEDEKKEYYYNDEQRLASLLCNWLLHQTPELRESDGIMRSFLREFTYDPNFLQNFLQRPASIIWSKSPKQCCRTGIFACFFSNKGQAKAPKNTIIVVQPAISNPTPVNGPEIEDSSRGKLPIASPSRG